MDSSKMVALGGLVGIPIVLLMIGSAVVVNALIYAILACAAFGLLIFKMKKAESRILNKLYEMIKAHPWATDVVFSAFAYLASPGGITGMLGASLAALFVSCVLMLTGGKHEKTYRCTHYSSAKSIYDAR